MELGEAYKTRVMRTHNLFQNFLTSALKAGIPSFWDLMAGGADLIIFGHLMQRVDSLEKTLMLGGIGSRRRRG